MIDYGVGKGLHDADAALRMKAANPTGYIPMRSVGKTVIETYDMGTNKVIKTIEGAGTARKKKKLLEYADWLSGVGRDTCEDCRETYRRRNTKSRWDKVAPVYKPPPCDSCRPELLAVNSTAVSVYARCANQFRFSRATGGLVLDNSNIEPILNAMEISASRRLAILDDVQCIASTVSALVVEDAQKNQQQ